MKKILLVPEHLKASGTTVNFYNLYLGLKKLNVDVDVISPRPEGSYKTLFGSDYIEAYQLRDYYDAVIPNSFISIQFLSQKNIKYATKIFSPQISYIFDGTHIGGPSVVDVKWLQWADTIVTLSEESKIALKDLGYESIVVNQPIDADYYQQSTNVGNHNTILSCVRGSTSKKLIQDAIKETNYKLIELSIFDYNFSKDGSTNDVNKILDSVDLTIGIGRIVYESLAKGVPAIVYDDRNYHGSLADGLLNTIDSFEQSNFANCSGRTKRLVYTKQDILNDIGQSKSESWMRKIILEKCDSVKSAKTYLKLI